MLESGRRVGGAKGKPHNSASVRPANTGEADVEAIADVAVATSVMVELVKLALGFELSRSPLEISERLEPSTTPSEMSSSKSCAHTYMARARGVET